MTLLDRAPTGSPPERHRCRLRGNPAGSPTYHRVWRRSFNRRAAPARNRQRACIYSSRMEVHTAAAYLRVFQPLAAFPARERTQWAAYVEGGRLPPASVLIGQEERRGLARALGLAIKDEPEHALVQRIGGTVYA